MEKLVVSGNTERFGVAAGLSVCSLEVRGLNLTAYIRCLRFLPLSSVPLIHKGCESFISNHFHFVIYQ